MNQNRSDAAADSPVASVNRLAGEPSAYLRQHAGNPVPWWPWCEAAIAEARQRDVPLLVSIGYSTCHWCHVMEHESFEDPGIAAVMDRHYVCVKVDREARPDLDAVWMTACQVFTAVTEGRPSGGWPLHVFLDPVSLQPFFAGTYFPPKPGMGRIAFPELLQRLALAWRDQRAQVLAQAAEIARLVRAEMELAAARRPVDAAVEAAAAQALVAFHDRVHGGFGGAPKFPQPSLLRFLQSREGDVAAAGVVHRTLERMALGGVRDQLDGGFHRYAVDAAWTVPHFEKMLYDQGQLLGVYAKAAAGDAWLAQVANELADFMVGTMQASHGGFVAALDADTQGREGLTYVWNPQSTQQAMEAGGCGALGSLAVEAFGMDRAANFRDPHHPDDPPSWVLTLQDRPERLAVAAGRSLASWQEAMGQVRAAMLSARAKRAQPFMDDCVIAAWNGLAIEGLADAAVALKRPELAKAAARAAAFVMQSLVTPDGSLARCWRDGKASGAGYLEDLACMSLGLLSLHRATGDAAWLVHAKKLLSEAIDRCWSDEAGWMEAPADSAGRFAPVGGVDDGAVPSGAGAISEALVACAACTCDQHWADAAFRGLDRASGTLAERPTGSPRSLLAAAALRALQPTRVPGGSAAPGPVRAELVALDRGGQRFELRLSIDAGHHVNAHDPGDAALVGLAAEPRDDGVRIEAAWPVGEAGPGGTRVHHGEVRVPIRLIAPQPAPRPLRLRVQWQCCTDTACLAPSESMVEA
jgi:uncharacterized protein YyaL (SSP411 family)